VLWGHRAPGAVARQPSPARHDHVIAGVGLDALLARSRGCRSRGR
jgi:hypothetical protein